MSSGEISIPSELFFTLIHWLEPNHSRFSVEVMLVTRRPVANPMLRQCLILRGSIQWSFTASSNQPLESVVGETTRDRLLCDSKER